MVWDCGCRDADTSKVIKAHVGQCTPPSGHSHPPPPSQLLARVGECLPFPIPSFPFSFLPSHSRLYLFLLFHQHLVFHCLHIWILPPPGLVFLFFSTICITFSLLQRLLQTLSYTHTCTLSPENLVPIILGGKGEIVE